jgi:outer membrane protein assembly factor BamA
VLFSVGVLFISVLLQDAPVTDSTSRARVTALPVVSYSDVTGLQYGATALIRFRRGADATTRASSLSAYASHTARGHSKVYAQYDAWSSGNRFRTRLRAEYMSYPLPYFGIGPDSPDTGEEWYSSGVTTLQAFSQFRWKGATYVHVGWRNVRSTLREYEAGGFFESPAYPGFGSDLLLGELGIVVDSRDNPGSPRNGTFARVIPSLTLRSTHNEMSPRRLTIDARRYYPVGEQDAAAFQVQYDGIAGIAPFDLMPMIGADTAMRGYARGRFRDQHAFTAQGEFRSGYWRKVGVVGFAGAGTVAPAVSDFTSGPWYPTVGAGLRYLLVPKDRTVARLDFALGRGSFGISVGIGEAF